MLSSHFIGEITEQQVLLAFLKQGILLSKPVVQSSRYDFIADIHNKLYKIQVKTCHLEQDESGFVFATSTSHTNTQGTLNLSYTADDVDYFATCYDNQAYLIPFSVCGKRAQKLRLIEPKNGQINGVKFAKDFKLEDIIQQL